MGVPQNGQTCLPARNSRTAWGVACGAAWEGVAGATCPPPLPLAGRGPPLTAAPWTGSGVADRLDVESLARLIESVSSAVSTCAKGSVIRKSRQPFVTATTAASFDAVRASAQIKRSGQTHPPNRVPARIQRTNSRDSRLADTTLHRPVCQNLINVHLFAIFSRRGSQARVPLIVGV